MTTTIKDFGRHSEKFGDISFYYAFPYKFWVKDNFVVPEDVLTWCREYCDGYYKVVQYTHEDSVRNGKDFDMKIMYVDKVYFEKEEDAVRFKLTFEVKDQQIRRPKLQPKRKPRKSPEEKAMSGSSPQAIALATRKHAEKMAKKAAAKAAKAAAKKPVAKKAAAKKATKK